MNNGIAFKQFNASVLAARLYSSCSMQHLTARDIVHCTAQILIIAAN